jgi:cation-transporting ATPase 13A1
LNKLLRDMEVESMSTQIRLGDASVASGFTSKTASIACALDMIRQGRCTLVTTLQMYKILAVNCLVTAYNLSALYLHGVKQGDSQMTFVGLLIAAFFFFVSRSKPLANLASERPPSRVFSPFVMLSVVGQCLVHFVVQVVALKWCSPHVDQSDPSMMRDGDFRPNVINTVVFLGQLVTQVSIEADVSFTHSADDLLLLFYFPFMHTLSLPLSLSLSFSSPPSG